MRHYVAAKIHIISIAIPNLNSRHNLLSASVCSRTRLRPFIVDAKSAELKVPKDARHRCGVKNFIPSVQSIVYI